jgi:Niemann-Pick C1 protein
VHRKCTSCGLHDKLDDDRIPPELFEKYLSFFLQDNPFDECPKGGHAAYGQGVTTNITDPSGNRSRAAASYFMTYHTILKTSKDYTDAMKQARVIAANISKTLNEGIKS